MSLILQGGHYEWQIVNGTHTYGSSHISKGTLSEGVYERIGIGNVVARKLELTLWNVEIDTSHPIVLSVREDYVDGTHSAFISKGTYLIDAVATEPYSEFAEIVAYDAILMTEVPYMKSGTFEPTTDEAVVERIAGDIGVSIEANTAAVLAIPMTINQVPSIGDNGTTDRQMLSAVACMRGGNFIINDDNELELVSLAGKHGLPSVITTDEDGLFKAVAYTLLEEGDTVVIVDSSGLFHVEMYENVTDSTVLWFMGGDGLFYVDTWANIKTLAPILPDGIDIGKEVVTFDISPTETIKRVEVWESSSSSFRCPSGLTEAQWNAIGGDILTANMPIMASQDLADALYAVFNGFAYVPYSATRAYFAPDVPVGTKLTIKDEDVLLTNRTLNIGPLAYSDLSAEATEQATSVYPKLSPVERAIKQDIGENSANITILAGGAIVESVRSVSEKLKASQDSQDAINKSLNDQIAEAKSLAQSLQNVAKTHNGEILGLQTSLVNQEGSITAITTWLEANGPYITTQQSYLNWDEINAILSVGKIDAPVRTEMRSDAFAVVENGQDVFSASDAGSNARSFNAVEKVTIGNFKWVDEGNNGFSLM